MSISHSGNLLNQVTFEEHDGINNAKRVTIANVSVSLPVTFSGNVTLDPGSRTGIQGNLTLSDSKGFIGLVTVGGGTVGIAFAGAGNITLDAGSKTQIVGNLTISDSKGFIGLVTVGGIGTVTLADPKGFIGLVTIGGGLSNVAVVGNVTLSDSKNYIGLVTVTQASSARTITGNLTLADSKGFIGLVTATSIQGTSPWVSSVLGNVTISDSKGYLGLITIGGGLSNVAVVGNLTLTDSKGFVGLVSVSGFANPMPVLHTGAGNVTLSDSKGFIGLVTIGNTPTVALSQNGTDNDVQVIGNVTITDSKGFIGLVTSFNSYGSNSTILTGVISATGFTTIATPPSNTRFFIKNIHVSSLGRAEIELRSGATAIIPFTSLSTTSGFAAHYGEMGIPTRAQNDTLVWNLNGLATIAYMLNVRSEA